MEGTRQEEVKVKVISREMVKPSSPTPDNLKILTLSFVDQLMPIFPPNLMAGIMFYPASPENKPLNIQLLKTSLSHTLTKFYPLAGRAKQSTITCNDEGIPFFEVQVDCPLSTVLYSTPKADLLSKILPPLESLGLVGNQPVTELIQISIQVSIFTCGGVVISWYDIHKITDGMSSANFFKHWAASVPQPDKKPNLISPDFDTAATIFPPLSNPKPLSTPYKDQADEQQCSVVVKSFIFKGSSLSKLKLKAATEQVPKPTRFLAVTGFIWEQALASKTTLLEKNNQSTALVLSLDMRPRFNPPLPKGSMGNLLTGIVVSSDKGAQLPNLVAEIHGTFCKKEEEIRGYNSENGVKLIRENWDKLGGTFMEYKDRAYKMISWSKIGYNELDFGFGKPKWMIPFDGKLNEHRRNLMILNDYSDSNGDDGIEAWLFLGEQEMKNLESNTEFLKFASPLF